MTTKKTAATGDVVEVAADHCMDKAAHDYMSVTAKTLAENPTINGHVAAFTQNEVWIFCTRCGKSSLLAGLPPAPPAPPAPEEPRNV